MAVHFLYFFIGFFLSVFDVTKYKETPGSEAMTHLSPHIVTHHKHYVVEFV